MKAILPHDSEMGQLILNKRWDQTPLGSMSSWPQSLKSILGLMLYSKFPMFLFWGEEATCIYNDAYRPSLGKEGKHPQILGQAGKEAWPEIWDTISPLIQQVMAGQGSCFFEDSLIPIFRNGKIEDVYWTFSYSPSFDEMGEIAGVVVTCVETTKSVLQGKRVEESSAQLKRILKQAPVAISLYRGPEHTTELINEMATRLAGKPEGEILGKSLFESFPELEAQGFRQIMDKVIETKKSFVAKELPVQLIIDGQKTDLFVSLIYEPLFDTDGNVDGIMAVGTDVTESVTSRQELNLAFEKIEESERQFRLLADSMPQFIWAADPEGRLNYYNQAVYSYSGLTNEQLVEHGWLQIVHPDHREENVKKWTESIESGKDFLFEHKFKRHDGSYRWQLSRAVPERDDNGKIRMWIGTSTDIQQIKEQEIEKDLFIGMASHELKTPVTSIKGYIDILRSMYEDTDDVFLKDSLSTINRQLRTMVDLIGDMLDLSKMKAGALILEKEHFQVKDMIQEVLDEVRYTNPSKKFMLSDGEEMQLYGDRKRISQVLVNFLTNAIKYSPDQDKIAIDYRLTDGNVKVSVKDTGIGINKKDQKMIFNRFYRVEGKNEKTYPGFGIGLYIASDIIKRHGGEIGVNSTLGEGSEFFFILPVQESA